MPKPIKEIAFSVFAFAVERLRLASPKRVAPWARPGSCRRSWSPTGSDTSRLAGADEDRTLARLRGLRSDLIAPAIASPT
jgi:hypothetical protein